MSSNFSAASSTSFFFAAARTWLCVVVLLAWDSTGSVDATNTRKPLVEVTTTLHEGRVIVISLKKEGVRDNIWIGGTYETGERRIDVVADALFHAKKEKTAEVREMVAKRVLDPLDKKLEEQEARLVGQIGLIVDSIHALLSGALSGNNSNIHEEL
jgi:hypothetical protein